MYFSFYQLMFKLLSNHLQVVVFTGIPASSKLSDFATTQNCPLETVVRLHEPANKSLPALWFCDSQKGNRFLRFYQ